jgi:hypothetical protein
LIAGLIPWLNNSVSTKIWAAKSELA